MPTPTSVVLTCPTNQTEAACQTQSAIDSKFTTWLNTATKSGGCNAVLTNNNTGAPAACGGTKTVTFTVTSTCEANKTCTATFTVTAPSNLTLTCPSDTTVASCKTQGAVDTLFTNWKNNVSFSGGCSPTLTTSAGTAPPKCGGSTTVTFTVTSSCGATATCVRTFTVTNAPAVVLTCPANQTEAACQTQTTINSKYNTWLASAIATGGCGTVLTNNSSGAPDKCGGVATVTFTATSNCEAPVTCVRTFTVTTAPAVALTCPTNQTEAACQTQTAINSKFATWLGTVTTSGGCNPVLTNNNTGAPNNCGGATTVTFSVTSTCETTKTCSATFTVTTAPALTFNCPVDKTEASCQTQAAINTSYANWLATATVSGGCSPVLTNNSTGAPDKCGGAKTVTFTVTDVCSTTQTCSKTFTVTAAPPVVLTCPVNKTEDSCKTQAEVDALFATWLATASKSGGCNAVLTNNNTGAPNKCGGVKTVIFTVTSDCEANKTCTATYTMPTDHAPGITGKLDTINVNGGCSISYLPPPYTTVAELESHGLNITDCTPDANLVVSNVDLNASGNCPLNVTRVYYVTDACSNSSSSSQIITIQDTIKPTFTKPADFQMYKGNLNPDNATLVNYDFDAGTSYPTLCPILFSGITSTFNANSNTYKSHFRCRFRHPGICQNINAGKGLQVDSSHQTGFWQIDLKGENLNKCTDFGVYVQAYKNATKSADTLKFQYSTNGSTWNTFRTTTLSTGTWVQDTGKITGVSNPDSLFLRVTYSGGGTGSGNKALYIDNLQVKSKVCCVYEAVPFITGDVTNENDNCATNLVATFCDSVTTEPCSGSTKIYRKWMLEDSCGNKADPQTQIITISDTSRPTFTKPADITLYNGVTIVDTHTLVHYNFNRGNNYQQLVPRLYYGIGSNVDTSTTNKFKQDTGTKTSTLAFYNDTIAGRSLRVDSSNNNGNWTFKLYGATLPICSNFEVYLQTKRSHSGSADTILYQYSLDSVNYFTFKSVPLILGSWKQDTGKIPITGAISKLFVRFKYKGGDTTYPKKLLIDNFQVQAIVNWDSCSVDPSPDVTGWPTDLKDNCDPYPSLKYEDVIEAGTCPKNYTINRTWKAIDDCQNERKNFRKSPSKTPWRQR